LFLRRVIQIPFIILLIFWCGVSQAEKSSPVTAPSSFRFTENKGQWDSYIKYQGDLTNGNLIAEKDKLTFLFWDGNALHEAHEGNAPDSIRLHAIKINFLGSNAGSIIPQGKDAAYRNYFLGSDPNKWAGNVGMYQKLTYKSLYAGVDAEILGSGDNLKYNFIVAPNATTSSIKIKYEGVEDLHIENGELHYKITFGTFKELQPYAYQNINGVKQEVACEYKLDEATNTVSFVFPTGYNNSYELVIDPVLIFASYTGSTADNFGFTATYDDAGNLYAGGSVYRNANDQGSPLIPGTYPLVGAFQSSFQGGSIDMGISKFNSTGTALLYSTYLGGNGNDYPHSLIVNQNHELYILGSTKSTNFPVTPGAFDVSHPGTDLDIVVVKFSAAGNTLLGSTYVGGTGIDGQSSALPGVSLRKNYGDEVRGEIILDSFSNVYVASCTYSTDFPVTAGAYQTLAQAGQNGCLFKMNPDLTTMTWATYLGGGGDDACYSVKLDKQASIFVTGGTSSVNFPNASNGILNSFSGGTADGYIVKLNNNGAYITSTYLGTSAYDQSYFVEVDDSNNVYVVGQTNGAYPVTAGVYSNPNSAQFIHKLNNNLSQTLFSTVFGDGSPAIDISPTAFLVDNCFNIYVSGWGGNVNLGFAGGSTTGLPVTLDALDNTTDPSGSDLYFICFDLNAQNLKYGSFYGGNGSEHVDGGTCRFDKNGIIYSAICAGCGNNSLFPTTPGVVSNTNNSDNCNLAALKLDFQLSNILVDIDAFPRATGCIPLSVQFQTSILNATQLTWDFGDGSPTSNLNAPLHVYTDTGIFRVMLVGFQPNSCNQYDTAYLDVWVRDDSITANFTPGVDIDCDSNKVMIISQNYSTTQYSWTFGDGGTSNNDTAIHYYSNPGTYAVTLIVSDTSKCNLQDTFVQPIRIPPILNANFSLNDSSGCIPLGVTFNAPNVSTANYLWNFGDNTTATGNATTHTYSTAGNFTVMLIVTDTTSCNLADTAIATIVTIDSSADADFNISRTFFGCDSVMVTVWSEYQGEESELWDFGDGFTSTLDTVSHTYTTGGNFTLAHYLTDADMICKPLDTMEVIISLTPLHISATVPDSLGCYPFTATFTGSSLLLTTNYFWFFGDGDSASGTPVSHTYNNVGTFNVITVAVDSNACVSADTVYSSITVINDSVEAIFNLTVLNDCDSNLLINLTNNSVNALQYNWYFSDGTTDNSTNPTHTFTLPGTYSITLVSIDTNRCHPTDTAIQSVTMLPNSWVDFTTENVCDSVTVFFTNLGSNTASYVWNFGDGNNASTYNASHLYALPNTYTVQLTITDTTTCDVNSTATHDVTVYTLPKAMFDMQKDTFKYLTEVDFINLSSDYNMSIWDFGDGIVSADNSPTHFYSNTIGWVDVCLNVYTDGVACYDTLCDSIYISYDGIIGVPNAFTPNGDGINDVIRIEGKGIVELDFRIYNRWGEQVFRTTDQKIGWDGFYKGLLQEMESYTYTAECTLINLNKINLKGNITLLR
jgi:gliding motility-associated-like protein